MLAFEILVAFLVALIFSVFLGALLGWQMPGRTGIWPSILFLFFVIFLATLAGGARIESGGPTLWGVYWVPFLIVGFVMTLLIAALVPPRRPRTAREAMRQATERAEAEWTLGIFFWLLILVFGIIIISRYV
jgi:hypothetical protein